MRTSGRYEISRLGSSAQIREAENPRRLAAFFMGVSFDKRLFSGFRSGSFVRNLGIGRGRGFLQRWRFSLNQSSLLAVVVKDLGVPAPVHRRLALALYFIFGKVLVENVVKKLVGNCVVGLAFEHAVNLFEDGDMLQRGFTEQD